MDEISSEQFHCSSEAQTSQIKESSDRTARRDIPNQVRDSWRSQTKSIRLALMLYRASHFQLEELQIQYIADFQRRLDLSQIQKALRFLHTLSTDPRTRQRLWAQDYPVPFMRQRPQRLREQRRIGVGYRDKGSLPKNSKIDWTKVNERSVTWKEETPSVLKGISEPPLDGNVDLGVTEPAEEMSDVDRPSRSKFHSYYFAIICSLELETLSVSEEIAGFSLPHGNVFPSHRETHGRSKE